MKLGFKRTINWNKYQSKVPGNGNQQFRFFNWPNFSGS